MKFIETPLSGAFVLEVEKREDERGFFGRSWCVRELTDHGLDPTIVQANVSFNRRKGTLRGMHFQTAPHEEVKIVRCTRGSLYDVIVDLRPESPTYCRWFGVELSADNYRMLYIPKRFGHGYQTLEDTVDLMYMVSTFFAPDHATGVMYNDPVFGIQWPLPVAMINEKDRTWPRYVPLAVTRGSQ
jgi:dTDP-4-dehydrorhamnose 3,5-epimerase